MVYGMGNYIKILAVVIVLVFAGCKDWLDVTPAGQATESDLFSTGDGYRSVLNGLYKSMGKPELYGRNWSYGMLDCMAQLYNLESGSFNDEMCKAAAKYEYTNTQVSSSIESAWGIAYNIIANANDLLQNIENASNDIFAEGEMERKMITGEAYACRALIHFELLRLFAPAPVNDDGRAYIPYIESYPVLSATKLGVKPVLEKVIADLEKARGLVAVYDTTINGQGINLSGTGRFNNDFTYNYQTISGQQIEDFDAALIDDFFKGRGYRMSYNAVTALLARVCQYAGRDQDAFNYADEVVKAHVVFRDGSKNLMYKDDYSGLTQGWGNNEADFNNRKDYKTMSNLIFAAYNSLSYQGTGSWLSADWKGGVSPNWFQISESYFSHGGVDEKSSDHRWNHMIFLGSGAYPVSAKYFIPTNLDTRDKTVNLFPVIRLTEMKYIMAEYYARNGNVGDAYRILNEIRENRGIYGSSLGGSTWNEFEQELLHDARREWISEGQLFFLYKRLNAAIVNDKGTLRPMTLQESMFPVPADIK